MPPAKFPEAVPLKEKKLAVIIDAVHIFVELDFQQIFRRTKVQYV